MIKAKISGSLNFPKALVKRSDLEKIAKNIIIKNIKKFLDAEVGVDGKGHPDLEPATWKRKKSGKKLYETGKLRRAIRWAWVGSGILIDVRGKRKKIAEYLQVEGVGKKRKKFLFFAVNDVMEDKAVKFIRLQIKKAIQRGGRRKKI